jgi:hypothetical protein
VRRRCDFCDGRPFCARCRPTEFQAEVDRRLEEIRSTGEMRWNDPATGKAQVLDVAGCVEAMRAMRFRRGS